jgi:hypothetical protein
MSCCNGDVDDTPQTVGGSGARTRCGVACNVKTAGKPLLSSAAGLGQALLTFSKTCECDVGMEMVERNSGGRRAEGSHLL